MTKPKQLSLPLGEFPVRRPIGNEESEPEREPGWVHPVMRRIREEVTADESPFFSLPARILHPDRDRDNEVTYLDGVLRIGYERPELRAGWFFLFDAGGFLLPVNSRQVQVRWPKKDKA